MLIFGMLACWVLPSKSWAVRIDGIEYKLDTNSMTAAVDYWERTRGDLIIPATVEYNGGQYTVTRIVGFTSQYCVFSSVYIPYSVTNLGPLSFDKSTTDLMIVDADNPMYDSRDNCNAIIETATNTLIVGFASSVIPNSVTSIGDDAFHFCVDLTTLEIPDNIVSIGICSFEHSRQLISVSFGNGLTTIGGYAFLNCENLSTVTFPNSLTNIGMGAFEGTPWYDNQPDGLVYAGKVAYAYKGEMPEGTAIVFKEGTLGITDGIFSGCIGLTSVEIPNSVTSISSSAFYGCTNLTSMEIPNSVTSIGYDAFSDCTGLTTIEIPNSVTSIGGSAFSGCTGLASIEIPNSVTSIGSSAFSGTPWYENQPDGLVYAGKVAYKYKGEMPDETEIVLEEGTLGIATFAFSGCTGLASIEIPNSVTSIGEYAFGGCTGLASVEIPNSMTSIGSSAFYGCTGLTSMEIPNSVTSIGSSAFSGCTGLTSMEIPNSVTSIGGFAFYGCTGFTSVEIPNSVTSIGEYAFSGCTGLTSVEIPNSVTSIGWSAFYGCTGLTSITAYGEIPAQLASSYNGMIQVFDGVDKTNCILYVPVGSKSAYENAPGWSEFQNIVEFEPDTDISALDNAIYVEETEARIGGTMDIPVKLKNDFDVRGFQFTMELPEGTTVNSWRMSTNRLPAGATESDKIATQKIDGNTIAIACSLNYGEATFTGNDGEIATVNVTFGEDMEEGRYPIYLTACSSSDAEGFYNPELSDVKSTLSLEDYEPGDANGDGKVLIGDAIAVLNYIVGYVSDNFKMKAADVNGDGKVLIGDVIAVLNIIVNQ